MIQNIIIIGDTHFGVRNNSMVWLKHQRDGFMEIIKYMEESIKIYDETIVIHVGDLFDSRSSINPLIYKTVEDLMRTIDLIMGNSQKKSHMYIIGGNHDYYYQWESENNYSATLMLPEFDNITYVNKYAEECTGGIIMIPWFLFHNPISLEEIIKDKNPAKNIIFTHTDPINIDPEIQKLIYGYPLITGHIHQPMIDRENSILITGASYPIDFADTNSERGFWTMTREFNQADIYTEVSGMGIINFHPIKSSIHFFTITEQMLPDWGKLGIKKDDYVEIQIRVNRIDDYKDILKELNDNFNINIIYLIETNNLITEQTEILDVDSVCRKLLPERLKHIYKQMVESCKSI